MSNTKPSAGYTEPLVPLTNFFPNRSARWIAEQCRLGRIPHAVKIGKVWSIAPSQFEGWKK